MPKTELSVRFSEETKAQIERHARKYLATVLRDVADAIEAES